MEEVNGEDASIGNGVQKHEKAKSMNIVLPESLHRKFKLRVVAEGRTAKEVIVGFIQEYTQGDQP